jgi:hypothetical protein
MELFEGGCSCGKVRFTATGQADRVGICHCLDCRKHHGALFYAAAIYPADRVTVKGETHHWHERHFCAACGSPVFARSGDEVELHLGSFDEQDLFRPTYECFTLRRESFLPAFPGTTLFLRERE